LSFGWKSTKWKMSLEKARKKNYVNFIASGSIE
jgi:hypothetical protein